MANITYSEVTAKPSCGREIIAMEADDTTVVNISFKAIRDSCGYSNESFMTVDDISVMCCNLCYVI